MIIYSKELKTVPEIEGAAAPFGTAAPVEPLALVRIPFEQSNPSDSRILRSMALYLSGIHRVTIDGI